MIKRPLPLLLAAFLPVFEPVADEFAFNLYRQLAAKEGNLFFSPASIEAALSLAREGAAGNTRLQFDRVLPQPRPFPNPGDQIVLDSANAVWFDQSVTLLDSFIAAVTDSGRTDLKTADFIGQPNDERRAINQWVEEKTRERIKNLLPPGSVDPHTRLVLVNALYFKGDWLHAFEREKTEIVPFFTAESDSVRVAMMSRAPQLLPYTENEAFQMVELPYKGERVSMLVVLPKERTGLQRVEAGLSATALQNWISELRPAEVHVSLPRFKLETEISSLCGVLQAIGVTDAFDPGRADFSLITDLPLFISDVIHKAFVQVDEEGTEAAAATGVIMRLTAIADPPKVFRVDRPFLFFIRHRETETLLFMGRLRVPQEEKSPISPL